MGGQGAACGKLTYVRGDAIDQCCALDGLEQNKKDRPESLSQDLILQ